MRGRKETGMRNRGEVFESAMRSMGVGTEKDKAILRLAPCGARGSTPW